MFNDAESRLGGEIVILHLSCWECHFCRVFSTVCDECLRCHPGSDEHHHPQPSSDSYIQLMPILFISDVPVIFEVMLRCDKVVFGRWCGTQLFARRLALSIWFSRHNQYRVAGQQYLLLFRPDHFPNYASIYKDSNDVPRGPSIVIEAKLRHTMHKLYRDRVIPHSM